MADGMQLPINTTSAGRCTSGFCTIRADKRPQVMLVPSKRVLPIIFIPGIMGSNLRMSSERQALLHKNNNLAWRVDSSSETVKFIGLTPEERQRQLDPEETCVDTYEGGSNETGNPDETSLQRNQGVALKNVFQRHVPQNPGVLLITDPLASKRRKTHLQKALERGWGEVLFDSYGELLQLLERHLNEPINEEHEISDWWKESIAGINPKSWGGNSKNSFDPINSDEIKRTLSGTWFPVHAMGYNWLESNADSGSNIAKRIIRLKDEYSKKGFECEKVIIITHSMGGLVARAAMHPLIGNIEDITQGVIHGAMPSIGSGTAYKRMRCGFEGNSLSIVRNILGKTGAEVTAVLANAQGGLELLPTSAYGNGWLQVIYKNQVLIELPRKNDPLNEIYAIQNRWFQLLKPEWINPALLKGRSVDRSIKLLKEANIFHDTINNYFHPNSYAIYGADANRATWGKVKWQLDFQFTPEEASKLAVTLDSGAGEIDFSYETALARRETNMRPLKAVLVAAEDPGDETVPIRSTDSQRNHCKVTFRQTGYEHQASYKNSHAISATFYSLIRIIQDSK